MVNSILSKNNRIFLLLILLFTQVNIVLSQEEVIQIRKSTDRVMIDGRAYYIHIVKEGHTLYSISKVYQVSQKEISVENPTVVFGLRPGQALKIPIEPAEKIVEGELEPDKFIYHTIEEGETVYALSKRYEIEEEKILENNPDLVIDDIDIGTVIKIPKKIFTPQRETFGTEDESFVYHRVDRNETLYSISKEYDVTIREIRRANRDLKGNPVFGEYIRIPVAPDEDPSADPAAVDNVTEMEIADSLQFADTLSSFIYRSDVNVALLLPFYLDKNDERIIIDSSEVDEHGNKIEKIIERDDEWIYPRSYNYIEFYEGVRLAIESLRREGLSVNLSVFDTERDSMRVQEIVDGDSLRGMDLIIGPVFTHNLKIVAEYGNDRRIPVVSPLASRNDLLTDNPYLFQVQPSFETEIEKLGSFVAQFYDKNIVLIHPGDSLEMGNINYLKRRLFYHLSYQTFFNEVIFKEVLYNEDITKNDSINSLEHALSPDAQNIVIVASDEEAFVSSIISNLNTLSQDYAITLFGYQSWQRFRNIELQHFYNLNLHICVPYILDYDNEMVKDFIRNFREIYRTEPQQFSFAWQGHDIMYYFLSGVARYGRRFRNYIMRHSVDLLESEYQFRRVGRNSGFENKQIHLICYEKDFEITTVKTDYESNGINLYDWR